MNKPHEDYCEVSNKQELLKAMKNKELYICIKGEMNEEVKELLKGKLSDDELMGAELGSRGMVGLWSEIPYQIIQYFSGKPKMNRKLESSIRQYNYVIEDGNLLLYHKQLDY